MRMDEMRKWASYRKYERKWGNGEVRKGDEVNRKWGSENGGNKELRKGDEVGEEVRMWEWMKWERE